LSNTTRYDGKYLVDNDGNQYLTSTIILDTTQKGNIFIKKQGNSWQKNQSGLILNYQDQIISIGSDKFANVYLAIQSGVNGKLMKLPFGENTWTDESNGLNNSQVYVYAGNPNNQKVYVGTYGSGIYVKISDSWQQIPNPLQVQGGSSCFALSVDPDGTLFACFGTFDASFNFVPTGTYFTNDDGKTWASADLDSINTTYLASYSDGTYALTDNGFYTINKNFIPTLVSESPIYDTELNLEQNFPNPFSESTTIGVNLINESRVKLNIYNFLGEKVTVLVDEYLTPGSYNFAFNRGSLPEGVYFYQIISDNSRQQKGMIILNR